MFDIKKQNMLYDTGWRTRDVNKPNTQNTVCAKCGRPIICLCANYCRARPRNRPFGGDRACGANGDGWCNVLGGWMDETFSKVEITFLPETFVL